MATITSSGLGSGIDIDGIVSKLMAVERAPIDVMKRREEKVSEKLSAFGSIKGAVSSFRDAMKGLSSLDKYRQKKVEISEEGIAKVATNTTAVPGAYDMQVTQLAQSLKVASKTFASVDEVIGTGTLTIDFGTFADGDFSANPDKPQKAITIDAGHSSLSGIRDAINQAKVGVSASILNDGTGYRLVIKSDDTGIKNGFKIGVTADAGDNGASNPLALLAYDPAVTYPPEDDTHMRARVQPQDALLVVDGVNIRKSSNVVTDVIQGVTMNLTKPTEPNTSVKVAVAQDKDKIKEAIGNFVKTYNDVRAVVKDLTAFNAETKTGAVLQGDYLARSIVSNISRTLTKNIEGLTGEYSFLAQIGISLQRDGTLAMNDSKVTEALEKAPDDVAALFSEIGRASDGLVKYSSATAKTLAGTYDVSVSQLGTRGTIAVNGFGNAPFTVNSGDALKLTVDGIESKNLLLTAKTYTTAGDLIAEVQSKINGDVELRKKAKSVTVEMDGGSLKLTSNTYGSESKIAIASMTLGGVTFSGNGSTGQDVQGTLGGHAATGKGQNLQGAAGSDLEGLQVQVLGGALGARGTVSFSHGYAFELGLLADTLLDKEGPLETKSDSLNAEVKRLQDRQQAFEDRMVMVERRFRAQFTAMDKLVGQLRSTGDYLTRQLR